MREGGEGAFSALGEEEGDEEEGSREGGGGRGGGGRGGSAVMVTSVEHVRALVLDHDW